MSWDNNSIRVLERESIRRFVESCAPAFDGKRVLDYGCGKQPYEEIVKNAGGDYRPYDRADLPSNISAGDVGDEPLIGAYDTILCTQVMQFVPEPLDLLCYFALLLDDGGALVLTYATNWDEVEPADLHRFTRAGMEELARRCGWQIDRHERRAEIDLGGFRFPLGYGMLAKV